MANLPALSFDDEQTSYTVDPALTAVDNENKEIYDVEQAKKKTPLPKLNLPELKFDSEPGLSTTDKVFDISVKTPAALAFGMASWPFAQSARFGAMYGQKAQQALGIVPKMTDEEITDLGNQTAEWFSSLGGNLTPKSEGGKKAVEYAGEVVKPLASLAHWVNSGIDEKKYPHARQLADTTTEGMFFGFLHKFGSEGMKVGKKQLKARSTKKAKDIEAAKKAEDVLMKKVDAAAKKREFDSYVQEHRDAVVKTKKAEREAAETGVQTERSVLAEGKEIAEARIKENLERGEVFEGPTLNQKARIEKGRAETEAVLKGEEPVVKAETGEVRKPDLGKEPVSALPELTFEKAKVVETPEALTVEINQSMPGTKVKYDGVFDRTALGKEPLHQFTPQEGKFKGRTFAVEELSMDAVRGKMKEFEAQSGTKGTEVKYKTEEGIPRKEYQVTDEGVVETSRTGARKVYEISEEGISKIEDIPGQRKVYQILLDPLKNQEGAVNVEILSKVFGKAPKAGSLRNKLKKVGVNEGDLRLSGLDRYLKGLGQGRVDWEKFKKIADEGGFEVKKERLGKKRIQASKENQQRWKELFNKENKTREEKVEQNYLSEDIPLVYENAEYNLQGAKEGTYSENLYKYDTNAAEISAIRNEIKQGTISPALGKQAISNITNQKKSYNEPHWGDQGKDVMAHDRRHERTVETKEGPAEVVYVDEVQSNWHRDGAKDGYGNLVPIDAIIEISPASGGEQAIYNVVFKNGAEIDMFARSKNDARNRAYEQAKIDEVENLGGVPDAPFKKTWPQMVMRDVISEAVAGGKDGVAWSTGKMQAERWGGKAQTKRDAIYDKTIKKFMEKESGVKAELVDPEPGAIGKAVQPVWYVPITKRLRKLYEGEKVQTAIDTLLAPIKNQDGSVRFPANQRVFKKRFSEKQRDSLRKLGLQAEKKGLELTEYLKSIGMSNKEANQMKKIHEMARVDQPFKSSKTIVKQSTGKDPLVFEPKDTNVNVSRDAKVEIPISKGILDQVQSAIRTKTPSIVRTFNPSLTAIRKFKAPVLTDLWHKANSIERARLEDVKVVKNKVEDLRSKYPSKKLREEAYVRVMSKSKLGRDAMKKSGVKPIDSPVKYEGLVKEMEPLFKDMLTRINDTRVAIGKKKVSRMKDFMPMMAQEHFYDMLRKGFKGKEETVGRPSLVLDSAEAVNHRHSYGTAEATNFNHLKRGKLRSGVRLEMDPLRLYADYGNTALRHVHYSPLNAFVEQLVKNPFKDKNGKSWKMEKQNPELAEYLSRWSNKLAGRPNVILPEALRFVEKGAQKLSNNLTLATLGWSARTILVQPTALLPVMTEFGVGPTMKGLIETVKGSKKAPIEKSDALAVRTADAFLGDMIDVSLGGPVKKVIKTPQTKALDVMKFVDKVAARAAWRTAYSSARKTMSEGEAVKFADLATVRTQGSGFAGDLSPIQMNAIGKAVTLWQTFTINHINWIGKEILGIKNPKQNQFETMRRVMTYTVGSAMISTLFEDVMGIQSPQPAPLKAIQKGLEEGDTAAAVALKGMLELTEVLPIGSSVKFGSDPAGAVAQFLGDASEGISKLLPKALSGDKRAMQKLAFIVARGAGVPGAQQIKRVVTGKQRGETTAGAVLGRYTPPSKKKSKNALTRKNRGSRRTSRRRDRG
jgi:hypothetical protein